MGLNCLRLNTELITIQTSFVHIQISIQILYNTWIEPLVYQEFSSIKL